MGHKRENNFGLLHVYGFSKVIDLKSLVFKIGNFFFAIDSAYDCGNFIAPFCRSTSVLLRSAKILQ
jgi:hypothetical protein